MSNEPSTNNRSAALTKQKKFYIPPKTAFWSIVTTLFCAVVYIVMLIVIGDMTSSGTETAYGYYVVRDIFLVITTILLSTLLTSMLVETRTKNELYYNAIFDDVVSNPFFYRSLSPETKRSMLNTLEKELLFSGSKQISQMYESIQQKLSQEVYTQYYFSECNYHIIWVVNEEEGTITKYINRTTKIRSYEDKCPISSFRAVRWSGIRMNGCFTLEYVKVNGKQLHESQYNLSSASIDAVPINNQYTVSYNCTFSQEIELHADQDTVISVSYTTKVPLSDSTYVCLSRVPCKRFSVDATVRGSSYKLAAAAFGFLDSAQNSPPCVNDQEVRIEFDDWVFSQDGVTITMSKR